ncbi:CCHC-type domain-containing protein [Balamuthia mandrillaris]
MPRVIVNVNKEEPHETNEHWGFFEDKLPEGLQGVLTEQEFKEVMERVNELWVPVVELEDNEHFCCRCCACLWCLCTFGISCCILCCFQSCLDSKVEDKKKDCRKEIKEYFEDVNKNFQDKGVTFRFSPVVTTPYIDIKVGDESDSDEEDGHHAKQNQDKKEETTENKRDKEEAKEQEETTEKEAAKQKEEESESDSSSSSGSDDDSPASPGGGGGDLDGLD